LLDQNLSNLVLKQLKQFHTIYFESAQKNLSKYSVGRAVGRWVESVYGRRLLD